MGCSPHTHAAAHLGYDGPAHWALLPGLVARQDKEPPLVLDNLGLNSTPPFVGRPCAHLTGPGLAHGTCPCPLRPRAQRDETTTLPVPTVQLVSGLVLLEHLPVRLVELRWAVVPYHGDGDLGLGAAMGGPEWRAVYADMDVLCETLSAVAVPAFEDDNVGECAPTYCAPPGGHRGDGCTSPEYGDIFRLHPGREYLSWKTAVPCGGGAEVYLFIGFRSRLLYTVFPGSDIGESLAGGVLGLNFFLYWSFVQTEECRKEMLKTTFLLIKVFGYLPSLPTSLLHRFPTDR